MYHRMRNGCAFNGILVVISQHCTEVKFVAVFYIVQPWNGKMYLVCPLWNSAGCLTFFAARQTKLFISFHWLDRSGV